MTASVRLRLRPQKRPSLGVRSPESADVAGLRSAYLAHGGEFYGYARRHLGDATLAEEAVQETFLRAWRARKRFDPSVKTMRGWLLAIERRVVLEIARARSRRTTDPMPIDVPDPDDLEERPKVSWQVEEAIRRLPPEQRQVLVEVYYRGRTSSDVARALAISEGTVRSRLFHSLRALREVLEEMGWVDENVPGTPTSTTSPKPGRRFSPPHERTRPGAALDGPPKHAKRLAETSRPRGPCE